MGYDNSLWLPQPDTNTSGNVEIIFDENNPSATTQACFLQACFYRADLQMYKYIIISFDIKNYKVNKAKKPNKTKITRG